jgi:hypothetical protein
MVLRFAPFLYLSSRRDKKTALYTDSTILTLTDEIVVIIVVCQRANIWLRSIV